jgi:hypothetical protein
MVERLSYSQLLRSARSWSCLARKARGPHVASETLEWDELQKPVALSRSLLLPPEAVGFRGLSGAVKKIHG